MRAKKVAGLVWDVLFPKRCPFCGAVQGFAPACTCTLRVDALRLPAAPLAAPFEEGWNLRGAWACFTYDEPVRGAIWRLKFEGETSLAHPFAQEMYEQCCKADILTRVDAIVAAPASAKTLRRRGYNQSALLAQHLAAAARLPFAQDALRKTRDTTPQMELDRARRLQNLTDAFAADGAQVEKRHILLVDDIFTTGATVNECAAALLAAGAKGCTVICLAAARPEVAQQ